MIHAGVDIGKSHHCAAAIEDNGTIRLPGWRFAQTPQGFDRLNRKLRELAPPDQLRIGMEATGHYWILLHDYLVRQGWQVDVFNPVLSSSQSRTHLRGRKSDPDDALADAKVVRDRHYKPLAVESPLMGEIKTLCRQRKHLAGQIANNKKRLTSLVDVLFPEFEHHFSDLCGATALALLAAYPSARALATAHLKRLTHLITTASRGQLGRPLAMRIREAARQSLAKARHDPGREWALQHLIEQLHFFWEQRNALDARIAERYEQMEHPADTAPGIGPTTGPTILSEIGDLQRFGPGNVCNKLLAYAGAEPRLRTSGRWEGKTKMTKRGSRTLRTALYQAAVVAIRTDPGFRAIYDRHRERGKHYKVAVSHVMRKLLTVIYAIMRDGQPYDPAKLRPEGG